MADEGTEDTFVKILNGRSIRFKHMGKGQLLMLNRYARGLMQQIDEAVATGDGAKADDALNRLNDATWTAVESLFVDKDDIPFVQMGIIGGTIADTELMTVFSGGKDNTPPADDADPPAPKSRVAKKAAAAKKTANPGRARR